VKYDSKEDYHNLVDTLKKLAENDVWINHFSDSSNAEIKLSLLSV
jgi:hypothetical protein